MNNQEAEELIRELFTEAKAEGRPVTDVYKFVSSKAYTITFSDSPADHDKVHLRLPSNFLDRVKRLATQLP